MARKGNRRHIKGLVAPEYFGIHKKASKYVIKPTAGRHSLDKCVPIAIFAKRVGIANTTGEVKKLVTGKQIVVNGKAVSDIGYPVGLNDVVAIKGTAETYVVGISAGAKVTFTKVDKDADERTCKIIKKYRKRGGGLMFGLHDGTIVEGSNDAAVNDSVNIGTGNKIKKVLKLEKSASCIVIDGVHVGNSGTVKEIKDGSTHSAKSVVIEGRDGGSFETLVENIMVV